MMRFVKNLVRKWLDACIVNPLLLAAKHGECSQIQQKIFLATHLASEVMYGFQDVGFSVFSEFDEDGILLYIFARAGFGRRKLIEVGCGDGTQNNTSNLLINHSWTGILIDGDEEKCRRARSLYAATPSTKLLPPQVVHAVVSPSNVRSIIDSAGYDGLALDLLSVDIDSTDLWVTDALMCYLPRVVVVEINARWDAGLSMTTPIDGQRAPAFDQRLGMIFGGASLAAYQKMFTLHGYRLIGCNAMATNAFFMRNDVGTDHFPEVSEESVLGSPRAVSVRQASKSALGNYPWEAY